MSLALSLVAALVVHAAPAGPEGYFTGAEGLGQISKTKSGYQLDVVTSGAQIKLHPAPTDEHIMTVDGELWLIFTPDFSAFTLSATTPENKDAPLTFQRTTLEASKDLIAKADKERAQDEGRQMLRQAMYAEKSYYAERDVFSADANQVGLLFEACRDGKRAPAKAGELAGCHFVMTLKVTGEGPEMKLMATVTGVSDPVKGLVATMASYDRPGTKAWDVRSAP